jgi:hypothetical protein
VYSFKKRPTECAEKIIPCQVFQKRSERRYVSLFGKTKDAKEQRPSTGNLISVKT